VKLGTRIRAYHWVGVGFGHRNAQNHAPDGELQHLALLGRQSSVRHVGTGMLTEHPWLSGSRRLHRLVPIDVHLGDLGHDGIKAVPNIVDDRFDVGAP
jgi:hypothetical protein